MLKLKKISIFTCSILLVISIISSIKALNTVSASETTHQISDYSTYSTIGRTKDDAILITGSSDKFIKTENISSFTEVKYIPNANYFLINPKHHYNDTADNPMGTCTTVAMQMLVGYHNYYSDRRIIPQNSNGQDFLSDNYGNLSGIPIFNRGVYVDDYGCPQIGTLDSVYEEIFNRTTFAEGVLGQTIYNVENGVERFLDLYTVPEARTGIDIIAGTISANLVRSEIDVGRPAIVVANLIEEGFFHVVVAYGYAKFNGVDGFLVHYGWGDAAIQVWMPEDILGWMVTMNVNHTHHLIDSGVAYTDNNYRVLTCQECGYVTLDYLYDVSNSTINNVKYSLSGSVTIPASHTHYIEETATFRTESINEIGTSAFTNQSNITSLTLPSSISSINEGAFSGCTKLTTICLNRYTTIGARAFRNCIALKSITGVSSFSSVGEKAFLGCRNLTSISLGVATTIGANAFKDCIKLETISNTSNVVNIGEGAFSGCSSLTSISLPKITIIPMSVFEGCTKLNSITGIENFVRIGERAFFGCTSLTTITLSNINSIGILAFANCRMLENVLGFTKVVDIGERAFINCTDLQSITLPSTITTVGAGAFAGCNNLDIYSNSTNYVVGVDSNNEYTNILYNSTKTKIITTGKTSNKLTIPDSIIEIGEYAFCNNGNLQELTIIGNTTIKSNAFTNCSNLTKVNFCSQIVPDVETDAFANTSFEIYVPVGYEDEYYEVFGDIANNIPQPIEYQIRMICSITSNDMGYADAYFYGAVRLTYILNKEHYEMEGLYSLPNGQGVKYVTVEYNSEIKKLEWKSTNNVWTEENDGTLYINWTRITTNLPYEKILIGEANIGTDTINVTSGVQTTITAPSQQGLTFDHWDICGVTYDTATVNVTLTLHRSYVTGQITIQNLTNPTEDAYITLYYDIVPTGNCVAKGTLITLADGSQVPVENLTGNESLLVWNLKTGSFDTAPILFIDSEPYKHYDIINLYFSDGTHVKVIDEHAFFDFNLNKYVYLRSDASNYIGHYFNKQIVDENGNLAWARVQLTNVTITNEYTMAYSPVTETHLCLYVNGMLSMPGGIEGLVNTFEVDGDTMQIDQAKYLEDIETYGLFTYEEFYELYPVPKYMFDAVDGANLKVALGKGLITYEEITYLIERYSEFFV